MKSLRRQDAIQLEAAEGWLELGNAVEANDELERIAPQHQVHPDVLDLRWRIYAAAKKWDVCLRVAETLADQTPRSATAWLRLAASLHMLDQTEDACETLLEVLDEFPDNPAIAYQLACYFCQMEEFAEAKQWLETAFSIGDSKELKLLALKDPELKPLWDKIGPI